MKIITKLMVLSILLISMGLSVFASPIADVELKVDGNTLTDNVVDPSFEYVIIRCEDHSLRISVNTNGTVDDVQIEAELKEYGGTEQASAISSVFDMNNNTNYVKTLDLNVPYDFPLDDARLRIIFSDGNGTILTKEYNIDVDAQNHYLDIQNIIFSPLDVRVNANRSILTTVRLKNYGAVDEEDVLVSIEVPELGIDASDYIDEIEVNSSENSEELNMMIPAGTADGTYNAVINVSYDGGSESVTTTRTITVFSLVPPVITSSPVTSVTVNQTYNYDVGATDSNGLVISYFLVDYPTGMEMNQSTGLITWVPTEIGSYNVFLEAWNSEALITGQSFTINVIPPVMLDITDIDVEVDGKTSKNLKDNEKITKEAAPGSEVEFSIEVKNMFEELDIEDIEVKVYIKEIDDDEDLDESEEISKLRAGKDDTVNLNFKIPIEADEGDYEVEIVAEGQDENGVEHSITYNLVLEVEKEKHMVIIDRFDVSPTIISCSRNVEISVRVKNLGSNEEEATIRIEGSELGILNEMRDIILDEDTEDDESEFSYNFLMEIDEVPSGIYNIGLTVTYDDDTVLEEIKEIEVNECSVSTEQVYTNNDDNDLEDDLSVETVSVETKDSKDNPENDSFQSVALLSIGIIAAAGAMIYMGMFVLFKIIL